MAILFVGRWSNNKISKCLVVGKNNIANRLICCKIKYSQTTDAGKKES